MCSVATMFFFLLGGLEALLIRRAFPESGFLSADVNQIFTMHGVTMIFLFVMPFAAAFANYLIPLQIGARDVAFPRLGALVLGLALRAIFLNTSWIVGGGTGCGWFCYSPNSGITFSPTNGVDFYAIGLLITGIASLVSAVNLTVTCSTCRLGHGPVPHAGVDLDLLVTQFAAFALPVSPWRFCCCCSTASSTRNSST